MNGFDICRLIKFDTKTKNIPIVMMTVKAGENDLAQGKAVGADAYLVKPFDFDALHLLINKLLKIA
jgi:DNA-binding response OmpR family regulator